MCGGYGVRGTRGGHGTRGVCGRYKRSPSEWGMLVAVGMFGVSGGSEDGTSERLEVV